MQWCVADGAIHRLDCWSPSSRHTRRDGISRTSEVVRADSWMHSVFLIGGQARDGTSHAYGMSVCRTAILHHQIDTAASQGSAVFAFAGSVEPCSRGGRSRFRLAQRTCWRGVCARQCSGRGRRQGARQVEMNGVAVALHQTVVLLEYAAPQRQRTSIEGRRGVHARRSYRYAHTRAVA